MNKDLLTGRLTRAPELIQSPNAKRTYLNLAVRNRRSRDGEPVYVSATAFDAHITTHMVSGTDGNNHALSLVADEVEFGEKPKARLRGGVSVA